MPVVTYAVGMETYLWGHACAFKKANDGMGNMLRYLLETVIADDSSLATSAVVPLPGSRLTGSRTAEGSCNWALSIHQGWDSY